MTPLDSERDIINRLKEKDGKAMLAIFKLYHKSLYYFARQLVKNDEQAEDIVAEAFLKLWKKNDEFEDLDGIRAFMHVAIKNACLDYLKHLQRKTSSHKEILLLAEKDNDYLETQMIKANLLQIVFQEVENLPVIRRKIFKMIYLEDLTIFEIANRLKITADTVRVQKARAIHGLREAILKKGIELDVFAAGVGFYFIMCN